MELELVMSDAPDERRAPPARPPRAEGEARVAARRRGARSTLSGLRQSGSAKALFPRRGDEALEAVFLNTAGGVTGGDRLAWSARAEAGARLVATTQAAERVYRAQHGTTACIDTRLAAESGAELLWLPQETILFDGCALSRRLEADVAHDATLLALEALVLGRRAMGETIARARLLDRWRVRRGGRPVFAEGARLEGGAGELGGPAALGAASAFATLLLVAPAAEARLPAARAALEGFAGLGGASAFDGLLVARLLAEDAFTLRRALLPLIEALSGAPAPRVWTM